MKTFQEFILECYEIFEGSEIAARLADLAQSRSNKLFQGNRQWDPNRAKIQTLTRLADLSRARSLDKPEPEYAGMTIPPPGWAGKPADLPPRRPIRSRGGSGWDTNPERDRGNKDKRLLDFVNGKRDTPNMSPKEQEQRNLPRTMASDAKKAKEERIKKEEQRKREEEQRKKEWDEKIEMARKMDAARKGRTPSNDTKS